MLQLIKWILVGWFIFFGSAIIVSNAFAYTLSYTLHNASSRSMPDTLIKALPYYVSAPLAEPMDCIGSQQMLQEEFDVGVNSGRALLKGSVRPGRMFADQAGWIWITELDGNRISYLKTRYVAPRGRICRLQE